MALGRRGRVALLSAFAEPLAAITFSAPALRLWLLSLHAHLLMSEQGCSAEGGDVVLSLKQLQDPARLPLSKADLKLAVRSSNRRSVSSYNSSWKVCRLPAAQVLVDARHFGPTHHSCT